MTTLLDFATTDLARVTQDKTSAQSTLAAAQSALQTAQADRDAIAAKIADLQQQIAAKRLEIANAAMPADAEAAAADLETLLIKLNAQQARVVDVLVQMDTYQSQIDVQLDSLGQATTKAVQATSALATAQKIDGDHSAWHAALAVPPLQTISQQATDALAGDLHAQAKARAEAGFQAGLLTHVRTREANEQARIDAISSTHDHMQDDLDAKEADRGIAGQAAPLQTAYDRAEAAFRAAATGAQDRFNRAQGLLASIAAAPALPPAESARMLDATIVNAAKGTPVTNEEALETAQDAVTNGQRDLDRATEQVAVGLTPFMTVVAAGTALTTAQGALPAAQAAYTQANRDALDAWEVTVPDSSWSLLAAFDEADVILNDLKTNATPVKLAALETAMTSAATALAAKLVALGQSEHDIAGLEERVKLEGELLDAASRNGSARILNALRGDG